MDKKVLIGIPTAEYARRADFYDYFNRMDKPLGTASMFVHGQSPARNRNIVIENAIEKGFTHVLFLDDDIDMPADMLVKLLAHDLDIVGGLYLMRNYPHSPIMFDFADDEGRCLHKFLPPNTAGLCEVVTMGLGCVLISVEVFKKLEKPWVRMGEIEKDHWCDDVGLFKRCREKGFKLYCDLDIRVGHIASMIITPECVDGIWYTKYDTSGRGNALVPQQYPSAEMLEEVKKRTEKAEKAHA